MTIAEQAVHIWCALEFIGIRPSASMVGAVLRIAGRRFTNDDVRDAVRPLAEALPHPLARTVRRTAGKPNEHERRTVGKPTRAARGSQRSSKTLPIVQDSSTLLTTFGEAAAPPQALPEWAERIQSRVRAIGSREIRTLAHGELHDAASLHIIRFASRKNRDENAVRKAAVGIAGRIRNVVWAKDHPSMHDLTVREYFSFAAEVWEATNRQDWDTPWAVVAWAESPDKTVPA